MIVNTNFEQNHYSRTAIGVYRSGHDSNRLMKQLIFYDRSYYENIDYYDSMASLLTVLINEIS